MICGLDFAGFLWSAMACAEAHGWQRMRRRRRTRGIKRMAAAPAYAQARWAHEGNVEES